MEKKKKKVGKPTSYKKRYCKDIIDFFNIEPVNKKGLPVKPPMFGAFARKIGVYHQTMLDWVKKYPEFDEAYKEAKNMQQEIIIVGCLLNAYSASFGRFTMKNISDWRDNIDTHVSTDKGGFKLAYSLKEGSK